MVNVADRFELKLLSPHGIAAALEMADRYRLLNQPFQAESICLDVLRIEPENQQALSTMLLALTDQFPRRVHPAYERARALLPRLHDEYSRLYHEGLICERRGKAHWRSESAMSATAAYDWICAAMSLFEKAVQLRPDGDDNALLRWNSCARLLNDHSELQPREDDPSDTLLE